MADVAAPLDTTSTAVASTPDATPSPSSVETSTPASASAGDTAAAVWKEMQAAESGGTPPDAPQGPSPAQAATQPDGSTEDDESLPTDGSIPVHRHKAVLTNTRKKLLAEFGIEESTGADGARTFNHAPDAVKTGVTLLKWLKDDPQGFMRMVQSQIGGDAITQAPKPAEKPVDDPEPEPDIPLTDGRFVYSAQQQKAWMQWNARQERANAEREATEQRRLSEGRQREAQSLVAEAKQWPHFEKLRPYIKEMIAAHRGPLPPGFFQTAYITTYREHGQKLLRDEWEAERSGQLTRKAAASTVQPGAPRPSTPRPDSELTTREIIRQEARKLAAG